MAKRKREKIIGIVGDTHIPFVHRKYLSFLTECFNDWGVNEVVHIGDLVDNHALTYHERHPDSLSISSEWKAAKKTLDKYYTAFPRVTVTIGNHDLLPWRKAATMGIPTGALRSPQELFRTPPGWQWVAATEIAGVRYFHGIGCSGQNAYRLAASKAMQSVVIGHCHSAAGVAHLRAGNGSVWGMSVGCGVDEKSYAMEYGKWNPLRPVLGCGIVRGGIPYFVPMPD